MGPDPFRTLIGHEQAKTVLFHALERGRLAHAYLFVGPEGVGKRTMAETVLSAWLGSTSVVHPDVLVIEREIDPKTEKRRSQISAEQLRDACERLSMTALAGSRKALLLEEADRMSDAAANILLKTLEEPRGDTLFLLCTRRLDAVPATVRSRCQIVRLRPLARQTLAAALERRGLSVGEATALAASAQGCPGRALYLMRHASERVEAETAARSLVVLARAHAAERLRVASQALPKDETRKMDELLRTLDQWETGLRDLLLEASGCSELTTFPSDPERRAFAQEKGATHWKRALHTLAEAREAVERHGQPLLILEHVLLAL